MSRKVLGWTRVTIWQVFTFSRAIRQEVGHIGLSHLDVSDLQHSESKTTAEYLLQQSALSEWEAPPSALADKQHREFELLWSREPEVFLDHGKLKIPNWRTSTRTRDSAHSDVSSQQDCADIRVEYYNHFILS